MGKMTQNIYLLVEQKIVESMVCVRAGKGQDAEKFLLDKMPKDMNGNPAGRIRNLGVVAVVPTQEIPEAKLDQVESVKMPVWLEKKIADAKKVDKAA